MPTISTRAAEGNRRYSVPVATPPNSVLVNGVATTNFTFSGGVVSLDNAPAQGDLIDILYSEVSSLALSVSAFRAPALRIAQIGDSRFALQLDGLGLSASSPGHWLSRLSNQRAQCVPKLNGAVGSERSDWTYQRLVVGGAGGVGPDPTAPGTSKTWAPLTSTGITSGGTGQTGPLLSYYVQQGVTHCLVILPINDHNASANYTYEYIRAHVQATIDALNSVGIVAVVLTSHPHDSGWTPAWPTTQLRRQHRLRNWLLNKAGTPGLIVVDLWDLFIDASTGLALVAALKDQTHWTTTRSYLVGKRLWEVLRPLAPSFWTLPASNTEVYDATDNPLGNLLSSGMLSGTTGTVGTVTGSPTINSTNGIATGWSLSGQNCVGLTITMTKATDPILGGDCQKIVISGTSGASAPTLDLTHSAGINHPSVAAAGAVLELYGGVSCEAGAQGIRGLGFGFQPNTGTVRYDGTQPSANPTDFPSEAWSGIDHVPDFIVPAGASFTAARFRVQMAASATIALTVYIKGCEATFAP